MVTDLDHRGNSGIEDRRLIEPGRVRELSRPRPMVAVRDTAVSWVLIVGAWLLAHSLTTWWATILAAVIVGNRYYALFIIGHDGLHRRLFNNARRNDLFCDLFLVGPIGAITRINNRNHLAHHRFVATADDPDRYKHACFNKNTAAQVFGYLTGLSSVVRGVRNVFLGPATNAHQKDTNKPRYAVRDLAILLGWQLALCLGLTLAFGWWGYPLLWLAPVFVFTFMADNARTFLEHSHPQSDADADQHRLITNHPGWLERQLLAPMNMNYHAAHHLWPAIPYYNLPTADRELRAAAVTSKITWRRSYLGYLRRYVNALPIPGCESVPADAG
jgi:fatty acid desaturase